MKVLVTGADGLLGANLVRELLDRKYSVVALIQPGSKSPTLDGLPIEKIECDLLDDDAKIADAMAGCDAIFHCAAITDQWADEKFTWKVNCDGTKNILEACLKAGVKNIIHVGSASSYQFGTIEKPGDETADFPDAYKGVAYVESKTKSSKLVREYAEKHGLRVIIVCPTFMLGPYDSRPSSGTLISQFIAKRLWFASPGGKNFVYVGDVAKAMANAIDKGTSGASYILGGGNLSYLDFFGMVAKRTGIAPPCVVLPRSLILLTGAAGSLFGKLTGKKVLINYRIARLSLCGTYYNPARAVRELDMPQTPAHKAIDASIESMKMYGHVAQENVSGFSGKVAIVTGASRGVGFATARELVLRGAKVVISARGEKRLLESKAKLEEIGGEVVAIAGDVGKWEDSKKMIDAAMDKFGRIDILVNNAGVSMRGNFVDLTPEVCAQITQTNLMGCIYPTKAAIDHIVASRGSVVFISSIVGLIGLPFASIYSATKKALTGLAESLRIELIPKGVHIGVVYLGFTQNDPEKRIIAADGSLVPPDRPAHHTQEYAANLIIRMIEKRRKQLIMTPVGILGSIAYRISPSFVEKIILKAQSSELGIFKEFAGKK